MFDITCGLQTYIVLLGSYIISCLPFEVIYQLGLFQDKLIQPRIQRKSEIQWEAFKMVSFNFCWLLLVLLFASPVLELTFPIDRPMPSLIMTVLQISLSFIVDDIFFYCYHRCLHANKALYVNYHKPHHTFKAPFVWTVSSRVNVNNVYVADDSFLTLEPCCSPHRNVVAKCWSNVCPCHFGHES